MGMQSSDQQVCPSCLVSALSLFAGWSCLVWVVFNSLVQSGMGSLQQAGPVWYGHSVFSSLVLSGMGLESSAGLVQSGMGMQSSTV